MNEPCPQQHLCTKKHEYLAKPQEQTTYRELSEHRMVPRTQRYMHCPTKARYPTDCQYLGQSSTLQYSHAHLQSHQKTLTLHIGKTEIDTSRVAIYISVSHNMFHLGIDTVDESLGQLLDTGMVALGNRYQPNPNEHGHPEEISSVPLHNSHGRTAESQ